MATIAAGSWAGIPQGDYSTTGLTLTIPPQAVVYNTGTVDVDNGTVTLSGGSWANVPQNNVTLVLTEGGTSRAYQVSSLTAGGCTILPASSEQIPPGTTDDFWLSSTDADYTLSWDTAPAATYQVNSLDPSGGTCTLSDLSGNPITDSSADCSNVNYTLSWPLAGGDAWAPTLTFNTGAAQPTDPPGPPQPTIWASDTASLGFLTNTPTGASGAVGANTSVSVIPPTTVGQATSDGTVAPSPGNAGGASVSQTVNIQLTPVSQADALAGTSYNNAVASGYVNTVYNMEPSTQPVVPGYGGTPDGYGGDSTLYITGTPGSEWKVEICASMKTSIYAGRYLPIGSTGQQYTYVQYAYANTVGSFNYFDYPRLRGPIPFATASWQPASWAQAFPGEQTVSSGGSGTNFDVTVDVVIPYLGGTGELVGRNLATVTAKLTNGPGPAPYQNNFILWGGGVVNCSYTIWAKILNEVIPSKAWPNVVSVHPATAATPTQSTPAQSVTPAVSTAAADVLFSNTDTWTKQSSSSDLALLLMKGFAT